MSSGQSMRIWITNVAIGKTSFTIQWKAKVKGRILQGKVQENYDFMPALITPNEVKRWIFEEIKRNLQHQLKKQLIQEVLMQLKNKEISNEWILEEI